MYAEKADADKYTCKKKRTFSLYNLRYDLQTNITLSRMYPSTLLCILQIKNKKSVLVYIMQNNSSRNIQPKPNTGN